MSQNLTKVELALKEVLVHCTPQEIEEYFKTKFLEPLNAELDGNEQVPAETIRIKRKQTHHIKNIWLTYSRK